MPKPVSIHPKVFIDVAEIVSYIRRDNPTAASDVEDAVWAELDLLGSHPELGPVFPVKMPKLMGIRKFPVPAFRNYLIFYKPLEHEVRILYVFHGARDIPQRMKEDMRE